MKLLSFLHPTMEGLNQRNSHGPLRDAKGSIYEGDRRVPMIFRYDGHFSANETRNALVGLNDLYATICALSGIAVPDTSAQDSISFAHHIYDGNNTASLRKWLATWSYLGGRIRKKNLKFVQLLTPTKKREIYDLDVDILGETNNLLFTFPRKQKHVLWRTLNREGPCPIRDKKKSFAVNGTLIDCDFFRDDLSRCREYFEGEQIAILFVVGTNGRVKKFLMMQCTRKIGSEHKMN